MICVPQVQGGVELIRQVLWLKHGLCWWNLEEAAQESVCTGGYVLFTFKTCLPMCAVVKTMCLKLSSLGWCLNHNFIFPLTALLCKTWHFQFSPLFSRKTVEVALGHSGVRTSWFWWCCTHRMAYTKYCELLLWLFAEAFCKPTFILLWGWWQTSMGSDLLC